MSEDITKNEEENNKSSSAEIIPPQTPEQKKSFGLIEKFEAFALQHPKQGLDYDKLNTGQIEYRSN